MCVCGGRVEIGMGIEKIGELGVGVGWIRKRAKGVCLFDCDLV